MSDQQNAGEPQVHSGKLTPTEDKTPGVINASCPTPDEVEVDWGAALDRSVVSSHALSVLRDIASKACVKSVKISSTARTPEAQAHVMYDNIQTRGIASQRLLYGGPAKQVLDIYEKEVAASHDRAQVEAAMVEKINELGPSNVSRHISQGPGMSTFDIAPSSIGDKEARDRFKAEAKADPRVKNFYEPPNDPGFHFEVPNP
jgi:hypothetical protein